MKTHSKGIQFAQLGALLLVLLLLSCDKTSSPTAPTNTPSSSSTTGGSTTGISNSTGGSTTGSSTTGGSTTGGTTTGGSTTGSSTTGGSTSGGSQTGQAIFWIRTDLGVGPISVYVSGSYAGQITVYSTNGQTPSCGTSGFVTVTLPPGTYSFNASASGGTTWNGSIIITAGGCYPIELYLSSGGSTTGSSTTGGSTSGGSQTGQVLFWTRSDLGVGNESVYVNGSYAGQITGFYSGGAPSCGATRCVTVTLAPGTYSWNATASGGTTWSGSVTITAGGCFKEELSLTSGGTTTGGSTSGGSTTGGTTTGGSTSGGSTTGGSQSCDATSGVTVSWTKVYSNFYSSWLYDVTVTNNWNSRVQVFISVYDQNGARQNIWEPTIQAGETRKVVTQQPMPSSTMQVGSVRYKGCFLDIQCSDRSSVCTYPN
jgi:hypothetical protein